MKIECNKQLKIKLNGSDADNLKSALNKIVDETNSIGFKKNNLSDNEVKVITSLSSKLNDI